MPELQLRVQTDGSLAPKEAIIEVCKQMISIYNQMGRQFTRENELRRVVAAGERKHQDGTQPGPGGI